MDGDPSTYERLLREAYDRGVADGRAAAALGVHDADASSDRGPEQLAASPWRGRPGRLPPGLPLNGARWYVAGYRAGLAEPVVPRPRPARPELARQLPGFEGV